MSEEIRFERVEKDIDKIWIIVNKLNDCTVVDNERISQLLQGVDELKTNINNLSEKIMLLQQQIKPQILTSNLFISILKGSCLLVIGAIIAKVL